MEHSLRNELTIVDLLVYAHLGSEINYTVNDVKIRRVKGWAALNKMDVIWKCELSELPFSVCV